jgi:hypothetical protein
VEIWTEKNAMVPSFKSIVGDRQVLISPFKGYGSVPYRYENCQRLREYLKEGLHVHILYFGDLDPSGEDILRFVRRMLLRHNVTGPNLDFRYMGVTEEQIEKYNLPKDPDTQTLDKLKRDTRSRSFRYNHNNELFQVEVDALPAIISDEFRKMVLEPIDAYFDETIYQKLMEKYTPTRIHGLVKERVEFLD